MTTDPARHITDEAVKAGEDMAHAILGGYGVSAAGIRKILTAAVPHLNLPDEAAIRADERAKTLELAGRHAKGFYRDGLLAAVERIEAMDSVTDLQDTLDQLRREAQPELAAYNGYRSPYATQFDSFAIADDVEDLQSVRRELEAPPR